MRATGVMTNPMKQLFPNERNCGILKLMHMYVFLLSCFLVLK